MWQGRDLLDRFKPVGTPGAATARGVPADRVAELAAELAPVFALLETTQAQCATIRAEADEAAGALRAQAVARAAEAVEGARRRAEGERAAAAAAVAHSADLETDQVLGAARRDAEAVAELAAGRLPDLLAAARAVMVSRVATVLTGQR